MQVLEHQHERPLLGERFQKASPCREGLAATITAEAGVRLQADEGTKVGLDPAGVARVGDGVVNGRVQLLGRFLLGVALGNARLRLHHFSERPEGDSVAVGEAAALTPGDELRIGVDDLRKLIHEPALAHSWYGDEGHELRVPLMTGALEGVPQDVELALAAHKLCAGVVSDVDAEARARSGGLPHGDRLGLSLRLDERRVLVLDSLACRPVSRLVGENSIHWSSALQPCAGVDDVAGCHSLTF